MEQKVHTRKCRENFEKIIVFYWFSGSYCFADIEAKKLNKFILY